MNTSIDHLPQDRQDLINHIVKVIVEKVDPEKVILFGSHATGHWQEEEFWEGPTEMDYKSDYDFLVITKSGERRPDYEVQEIIEYRSGLNARVSAITHDIDYINSKLSEGQYFFSEIQQTGILLYDAGNIEFAERRKLDPFEVKKIAQEDFDNWFESSHEFLIDAKNAFQRESFKNAAFYLHQATERAYNTVILVFRGYKPKTHNLEKLSRYAKPFSKQLFYVFPRDTPYEKHLFDLLRKGYIDARYDKSFQILREEVEQLIMRLERLHGIIETICKKRIASIAP